MHPLFATKANASKGGVGYEKAIVSAEVFENAETEKFIPVLRSGSPSESLPSYIKSRVLIDFSDDLRFEGAFEELLRVLHGKPSFTRPPLGPIPTMDDAVAAIAKKDSTFSLINFKAVLDFAWSTNGLDLSSREEAENWLSSGRTMEELEQFAKTFHFCLNSHTARRDSISPPGNPLHNGP